MTSLPERNEPPLGFQWIRHRRFAARVHPRRWLGLVAASLAACSPTLDWRDVRPAGSDLQLLMPCKPDRQERRLQLSGQPARLVLHVCSAGGQTWGLAFADVGDPARLGDVMQQLMAAAGANIAAVAIQSTPLEVPGATPHRASQKVAYRGLLPDGKPVQMQVAVFAHGTHAFQATVLGGDIPAEAVQTFMESIRFAR
jgi:hypothetical protein